MNSRRWYLFSFLVVLLVSGHAADARAQEKKAKEDKVIVENRELDRRWAEAFQKKDVEAVMSLYWNSPDLVMIDPDGSVHKGWDDVRKWYEEFFAGVDSVRVEFTESSHQRAGDGVLGFGSVSVYLQPKDGRAQQFAVRYTDFRRKQAGKWVWVHDHPAAIPPPGPKATDPLYKRLGGYDAIAAVVDDFLTRLLGDPQLKRFFSGVSASHAKEIRQLVLDQLCAATGGPCVYIGRDMKATHAGLGISNRDWEMAVNHLVATLDKFQVPHREKNEVLGALGPLKSDIVEK